MMAYGERRRGRRGQQHEHEQEDKEDQEDQKQEDTRASYCCVKHSCDNCKARAETYILLSCCLRCLCQMCWSLRWNKTGDIKQSLCTYTPLPATGAQ